MVTIYNITDQALREEKIIDNFSISDLPNGMSFMKIFNTEVGMIYWDKIVKY